MLNGRLESSPILNFNFISHTRVVYTQYPTTLKKTANPQLSHCTKLPGKIKYAYLLPLAHAENAKLFLIGDLLAWSLHLHIELPVLRLSQDLLGCNLNRRRGTVFSLDISIRRHDHCKSRLRYPHTSGVSVRCPVPSTSSKGLRGPGCVLAPE